MKKALRTLITPKKNPDLDGTACAFAYAEFLRKNGKDAIAAVFGEPHREAQFVINKFKIPAVENAEKLINDVDGVILVDVSAPRALSDKVKPEKVVEIVDHRQVHEAEKFPNAKVQIELVGSAATLIAEKFNDTQTEISPQAAALLFSAIISNTINFQATVTTGRDRKMADWLSANFFVPANFIHEMFADKSRFRKSLKETILDDFATFCFGSHNLGIAQLEIIEVDKFIRDNLNEVVKVLGELKKEKSLDLIYLSCIDLEKAFNKFVVIDKESQNLLERALSVKFKNDVAKSEGILMRKKIVPLVKEALNAE